MKIKKGNLNYDQSGRAYPDNPEVKENWNCIWENDGKYYKLVGDNEHKEWDEVNIYKQNKQTLYSEIETLIIKWNIDGTKTAGSLTRDIMKLLNVTLKNKAKESAEYKKIFSEIQPNRLISTEYGLGIIDSQTGGVTITPYPKVKEL